MYVKLRIFTYLSEVIFQALIKEIDDVIIVSIINLMKKLGLKAVTGGVETKKQLDYLIKYNCDLVQGWYFTK